MHRPANAVILSVAAMLALLCSACGESPPAQGSSAESSAETDGTPEGAAPAGEAVPTPEANCAAFPRDLLDKYGLQKQLVLNLSMAGGRNLKTMRETMGAPEPETFRRMAAGFENFDASGIEPIANFDTPDVITRDLGRTADLLAAALAAGEHSGDPAWTELSEFYTQKFFVHHNASISYYLNKADCV